MNIDFLESLQTQNVKKRSTFVIDPRPPDLPDQKVGNYS